MKEDCLECLSGNRMIQCYYKQLFNDKMNYDKVAIAVRHAEEIAVIFERNKKLEVAWYPDFLSSPFYDEISTRRFKIRGTDDFKKLFARKVMLLFYQINRKQEAEEAFLAEPDKYDYEEEEISNLKKIDINKALVKKFIGSALKETKNKDKDMFGKSLDYLSSQFEFLKDNKKDIINIPDDITIHDFYFHFMNILKPEVKEVELFELDMSNPYIFKPYFSLGNKVIIRGISNKHLYKDEKFK